MTQADTLLEMLTCALPTIKFANPYLYNIHGRYSCFTILMSNKYLYKGLDGT